jgi:hypothetical protein
LGNSHASLLFEQSASHDLESLVKRVFEDGIDPSAVTARRCEEARKSADPLVDDARTSQRTLSESIYRSRVGRCEGGGNEHQVHTSIDTKFVFRKTCCRGRFGPFGVWPACLGQIGVTKASSFHGWTAARAVDYLNRIRLSNIIFESEMVYEGLVITDKGDAEIIISQPFHVIDRPVNCDKREKLDNQRRSFFERLGFVQLHDATFYRQDLSVAIFDAHGANVIRNAASDEWKVIDVIPVWICGSLKEALDAQLAYPDGEIL